jgi:hypothetical protein
MTSVVNIKKLQKVNKLWMLDSQYVYIGRPGHGLSSDFGNPFVLQDESEREKVLDQYREYLEKRIKEDADFRTKVKGLYKKTLVCFCKPKACHGDILAEMVEKIQNDA